jgi:hypothetical protein
MRKFLRRAGEKPFHNSCRVQFLVGKEFFGLRTDSYQTFSWSVCLEAEMRPGLPSSFSTDDYESRISHHIKSKVESILLTPLVGDAAKKEETCV